MKSYLFGSRVWIQCKSHFITFTQISPLGSKWQVILASARYSKSVACMRFASVRTSRDLPLQFCSPFTIYNYPSGLLQSCVDKDSVLKTIPIQKKSNIDARNKNSTCDNPILCHLKLLFMILLTPSKIKQLLQNNKEQPKIMYYHFTSFSHFRKIL